MLRLFSYSFNVSDGSVEATAGRMVSPCSIMEHHGFRSREARCARKQKYRLRQTTSHSSLLVARQGDVSRKLNQAKIATMNCRTLSSDVRVKELQQLASDVLAAKEHKRTSLDVHKSILLPGWLFLLNEAPSPGVGGNGFLLSPRAVKTRLFFSFPSHSIEKIVLDVRDRRFHIFCVYAPTAVDNHKAECRTFYDQLSSLVIDITLRNHILICGDLNAPLTADGCRVKNVRGEPNSNSEALQAFINFHDPIAANGIMRQKRIKLPTFDGPTGRCTRLDWIFDRNRFRQCVHRVLNIKTTVLTSDHRVLLVDYLLRWPSRKKRMASEIDWSYIALPSTMTDLVTSTRQFQVFLIQSYDFVTALSSTSENSLPKSIAPNRVRSWNNNVEPRKARSQVQRVHHKFGKYSSQHSAALERPDPTHVFVAETYAMR